MNLFIALEKPGDFNFWFHDFCSILLNVQTKFTEFRLRKLSTNFYVKLEIPQHQILRYMYVVGIVILCLVEIIKFLMIFRAWPRTQLLTGSQTPPGDNYSILSRSYTNNKLLLVCNRIAVLLAITLTGSIAGSLPYWLSLSQGVQRDRCPIGYHSHREYSRIAVLLAITLTGSIIAGSLSY